MRLLKLGPRAARSALVRGVAVMIALPATGCGAADGSPPRGITYHPSHSVERLKSLPLDGDDIGIIRDFDLSGDTLILLDGADRVVLAERRDTMWVLLDSFGRAGGGPGEFLTASGLSISGVSIAVIDNTRLQFFTREGEHTAFRSLSLPCPMLRAGVAQTDAGLYLHGNCARSSFVTDTMKSVLVWSPDTATWHIIAEDLRFTRDGGAGNLFAASSALTPGAHRVHLFGSGGTNCIWVVSDSALPPAAVHRCPAAVSLYSADPPSGLRERLRSGAVAGMRLEWPETLPAYVERIRAAGAVLLVRPYSADSVVIQEAAPSGRDVAVGPLNGLVGCRAAGCLWVLSDSARARIIVLDTAALARSVLAQR